MARLPRYVIPGQPQHLIQRGNNRQAIFLSEDDYVFFRDALVQAAQKQGLAVHAYVWMTNHVHLLATPASDDSISKVFQSVGRRYVQYFNARYQRTGTLWEGRYRATVVDSERYLLAVMRYIELNPVRAGMVTHPNDYRWSSYAFNARNEQSTETVWLTAHEEYLRLGQTSAAREAAYQQLFDASIAEDALREIRERTHSGWALGDAAYQQRVESLTQRRAASKGIGRPRINRA
jgi:putative transposase